jgi:large subunit ribosomal protein L10Ae
VRENVAALLDYSNNTKKRNFLETVEYEARPPNLLEKH